MFPSQKYEGLNRVKTSQILVDNFPKFR
jgi:hypothetical protein